LRYARKKHFLSFFHGGKSGEKEGAKVLLDLRGNRREL